MFRAFQRAALQRTGRRVSWAVVALLPLALLLVSVGFGLLQQGPRTTQDHYYRSRSLSHLAAETLKARLEVFRNLIDEGELDTYLAAVSRSPAELAFVVDLGTEGGGSRQQLSRASSTSSSPCLEPSQDEDRLLTSRVRARLAARGDRHHLVVGVQQGQSPPAFVDCLTIPLVDLWGAVPSLAGSATLGIADESGALLFESAGLQRKNFQIARLENLPLAAGGHLAFDGPSSVSQRARLELGGVQYEAFLHPLAIGPAKGVTWFEGTPRLTSIVLVNAREFDQERLRIDYSMLGVAIFFLAMVVVSLPVLNVALMHPQAALKRQDVVALIMASLVTSAVVAVFAGSFVGYRSRLASLDDELRARARAIVAETQTDLRSVVGTLHDFSALAREANERPAEGETELYAARCGSPESYRSYLVAPAAEPVGTADHPLPRLRGETRRPVRSLFLISRQGTQATKWYANPRRVPWKIGIADRTYFHAPMSTVDSWDQMDAQLSPDVADLAPPTLWVESIVSRASGQASAIVSISRPPWHRSAAAVPEKYPIAAASTEFTCLLPTADPAIDEMCRRPDGESVEGNGGFAVVDAAGQVLFHSNSRRNLRENWEDLRALVRDDGELQLPRPNESMYDGRQVRAAMMPFQLGLRGDPLEEDSMGGVGDSEASFSVRLSNLGAIGCGDQLHVSKQAAYIVPAELDWSIVTFWEIDSLQEDNLQRAARALAILLLHLLICGSGLAVLWGLMRHRAASLQHVLDLAWKRRALVLCVLFAAAPLQLALAQLARGRPWWLSSVFTAVPALLVAIVLAGLLLVVVGRDLSTATTEDWRHWRARKRVASRSTVLLVGAGMVVTVMPAVAAFDVSWPVEPSRWLVIVCAMGSGAVVGALLAASFVPRFLLIGVDEQRPPNTDPLRRPIGHNLLVLGEAGGVASRLAEDQTVVHFDLAEEVAALHEKPVPSVVNEVLRREQRTDQLLLVGALDVLATDPELNERKLELLEHLLRHHPGPFVVSTELSPELFDLGEGDVAHRAASRWHEVLRAFDRVLLDELVETQQATRSLQEQPPEPSSAKQLARHEREHEGLPPLMDLTRGVLESTPPELSLTEIRRRLDANAGSYLHRLWSRSTPEERWVLVDLRRHGVVNWRMNEALASLLTRRLVVCDPFPRLGNLVLSRYLSRILELPSEDLRPRSLSTVWTQLRWPIGTAAVLLLLFIFLSQGKLSPGELALLAPLAAPFVPKVLTTMSQTLRRVLQDAH